jgi:hypothetical protein
LNLLANKITVRDGKGQNDRRKILPATINDALAVQVEVVRQLHREDLKRGLGQVYLPYALDRKYKQAGKEFAWQ